MKRFLTAEGCTRKDFLHTLSQLLMYYHTFGTLFCSLWSFSYYFSSLGVLAQALAHFLILAELLAHFLILSQVLAHFFNFCITLGILTQLYTLWCNIANTFAQVAPLLLHIEHFSKLIALLYFSEFSIITQHFAVFAKKVTKK